MKKRLLLVGVLGFLVGLACLPTITLLVAWLGLLPLRADAEPSAWERQLAGRALKASLAGNSAHLSNPLPITNETLLAGMRIYRDGCAGCHGDYGQPSHWGTHGFYPPVPQSADQPSSLTTAEMFLVVKHGIRYSAMGGWNGMLPDEDIWRVATFLGRLRDLPQPVEVAWKAKPRAEGPAK
jgi:thiosulfate dehydrogenase